MTHFEHEGYEPAAKGDLDADVAEEEERADPGYGVEDCFFGAGLLGGCGGF